MGGRIDLAVGTRLGTFEVTGLLGKGGMGEVYRARDSKLGRDVAIKILATPLSSEPTILARFEREAQSLVALDHPNIGALYDFQEDDGQHYLVMQLIEGSTLADRIQLGVLTLDEATTVFIQIAEGLEAAHEAGIVHRDLKPANIKITDADHVKILDFGITKNTEGQRAFGKFTPTPITPSDPAALTVPMSPLPTPDLTGAGVFIGTPQYMSPEQARGKPVDRRSDIWAFGVCLFEALTGLMPFNGESVSDLITAILRDEPNWNLLPSGTPQNIRTLLRRCVTKDIKLRLRDIGEAWILLTQPEESVNIQSTKVPHREVTRFRISFPENHTLSDTLGAFNISPDGTKIVCVLKTFSGQQSLFLRHMDSLEFVAVLGTERARQAFFSPDEKWLAFFQRRAIRVVAVDGGPIRTIVELGTTPIGAIWTQNNQIVWSELHTGLFTINIDGTNRQTLTTPDKEKGENWHSPSAVFGEHQWLIFNIIGGDREYKFRAVSISTGEQRDLPNPVQALDQQFNGGVCWYLDGDYAIFPYRGDLSMAKVSTDPPRIESEPIKILDGFEIDSDDLPLVSMSRTGSLVYAPNSATIRPNKIFWVSRDGERRELNLPVNVYAGPRISPDGESLVVVSSDRAGVLQLYLLDIRRGVLEKVTNEESSAFISIWNHDGSALIYCRYEGNRIFIKVLDLDSGSSRVYSESDASELSQDFSADGRHFAIVRARSNVDSQIFIRTDEGEAQPLIDSDARNICPKIDPKGENIAYSSNESGDWEVCIKPFGTPGSRIQVSIDGGSGPIWAPDGSELFYRNGDSVYAVPIERGGRLRVGQPKALFDFPFGDKVSMYSSSFDMHPDGDRFIMVDGIASAITASELVVMRNFGEEVKARLSGDKPLLGHQC